MSYTFKTDDVGETYKEYFQVNYLQKYYEELFLGMLETSHEEGLISHNDKFTDYVKSRKDISSYYVMTLSIIADTIEDVYYDMNDVYFSNKINYAIGSDLDDIGAIVGCPRPHDTSASAVVTFALPSATTRNIIIHANTIVATSTGISYYVVENTLLEAGNDSVDVYCKSLQKGRDYRVKANTLNYIQSDVEYNFSVTNNNPSSGGTNEYDDEEYRGLIAQWVRNQTKGSYEAYTRFFSTFEGIDGYKLIPNWNGVTGTLKIVLDPGSPTQLKEAYDGIMSNVCQLPEDIVMFPPEYVGLEVYATVNVDIDRVNPYSSSEKDEIKSRIIEAIDVFINGNIEYIGLEIGEDFIPYQLGVFINEIIPEVKNINFTNNQFTGVASPVQINDEQLGHIDKSNIHITME